MIELHLVGEKNTFFEVKLSYAGWRIARWGFVSSIRQCLYRTFGKSRENLEGDSASCPDANLAT